MEVTEQNRCKREKGSELRGMPLEGRVRRGVHCGEQGEALGSAGNFACIAGGDERRRLTNLSGGPLEPFEQS